MRFTEKDQEECLLSGLLLFIPCLFDLCEDIAVVLIQRDEVYLREDEKVEYSVQVESPEHPIGGIGVGGYFYLTLDFEGIMIW